MRIANHKSDSGYGDGTAGARNYQRECIELSFSSGGSSRNCYEELREIIRKSLVKQNLLPPTSGTGRTSPDCLSGSTSGSVPAKKKVRMPNVIARLMGLEELPLEDQRAKNKGKQGGDSGKCEQERPMKLRHKHERKETEMPLKLDRKIPVAAVRIDGRKSSNLPKPLCDMDMPMRRLSNYLLEEKVPRRRKLKEIIESMQLTGLLKGGGNHGEYLRPRSISYDKKQNEKMKVGGGKCGEVPPIVIIKPMVVTKVNRERGNMIQEHQPIQEKQPKALELRKTRSSDKQDVNAKNSVKPEMKPLQDLATKDEKDRTVIKKPLSVANHDRKLVPVSRTAEAVKAAMPRKPMDKLHSEKEQLRRCHSSRRNHVPNGLPGCEPRKYFDQMKDRKEKAKPAVELRPVNKMVGSKCKRDEMIVNTVEKRCLSTSASSPQQLGVQRTKGCSMRRNPRGIDESKPVALSEQTSKRICHGRRYRATKETSQQSGHEILCQEAIVTVGINKLKQFLLNSTSFLSAAQEYFDIEVTRFPSPANYKEFVGSNDKLLMDCVFELMKYKSQKHLPRCTITKLHLQKQKARFLLDVLVEELCKELETLFSFQVISNFCTMDDLYLIFERDLLCRRLNISCVWDKGWEYGALTDEESDIVICQLEMLVLNELIEETLRFIC